MGAILLAMTLGGGLLAAVLLIVSLITNKAWLRNFVLGCAAIWLVFYLAVFLATSMLSRERTLSLNEPKRFCGFYLDCHLSASVTGVRRSKTFGRLVAEHEFYIVRIKISSDAKRAALGLRAPQFTVFDETGRRFEPVEDLTVTVQTPKFEEKIPAGGALEEEIAFDLPAGLENARLDVRTGVGLERAVETILIGDEDSFLHRRTFFRLTEQPETAGVK